MKKTAFILMIITILSKIFGVVREITLSYFYGASNISDAYLISLTVPMVIFGFISAGISTGYIPMYSNIIKEYGEEEGHKFTSNLINVLLIICTILMILGLIFTTPLVKLFASGFSGETLNLAVKFTRISLLGIYFTAIISVLTAFLQIKNNYIIPALIAFPTNIIIVISIFISKNTNITILVIGSLIATIIQLLCLLPSVKKEGYEYKPLLDIKDKHINTLAAIAYPVIIGVSVNQINVLVDKTMASRLAEGGISALNYATMLNGFVYGIFVVSISTVMYPMISKMAAENNILGLKKSILDSMGAINLFVIPATIGFMIFAEPIVRLVFARGAFDSEAISMTSKGLFFYSISMVAYGMREVISRAFYALQDTKTPMINGTIAMVINVVLNVVLSQFLGIAGLALSTSISSIICTALVFMSLRKKIGAFGIMSLVVSSGKMLISSLIMGGISKVTYSISLKYLSSNTSLIIAVAIGVITYFLSVYFMKIKDVEVVVEALKSRINKKAA